jgi:hypothetical protein
MTCWVVMPCTLVDKYQYLGGTCCLNIDSSSSLTAEAVVSSPTLVIIYQTVWCNLQEDHNLNTQCHMNLKTHEFSVCPQNRNSEFH